LTTGTIFQNSNIHNVNTRIRNEFFSIGAIKEWRKSYSLNYDDVRTQDNKEERERLNIMWAPLTELSVTGEYSNVDGDGIYRILRPTSEDSIGDTLVQYRTRKDRTYGLNTTYMFKDKGKVSLKYKNRRYELRIPDSLPTATTENRFTFRGEERIKDILNPYQEIFWAHRRGLEPFLSGAGEIEYQVIGFEAGLSFIPREEIKGRLFFGYESAYGEASQEKKITGFDIYFSPGPIFVDGNGKYNISTNPDYRTFEVSINAGLRVE
jgi:hypothetical protein